MGTRLDDAAHLKQRGATEEDHHRFPEATIRRTLDDGEATRDRLVVDGGLRQTWRRCCFSQARSYCFT
jgi:hypothetical protein